MSPQQTALAACCRRCGFVEQPLLLSQTCKQLFGVSTDVIVEQPLPLSQSCEQLFAVSTDVIVEQPLLLSQSSEQLFAVLADVLAPNGLSPHSKPIVSTVRHRPGLE